MFKEGPTNVVRVIPEFDRGKLNFFLTGHYFQNSLNTIIARTRISGFEQALTVLANARTSLLSVGESREIDQNSVNKRFTEYIDKGFRPLIAIHTHAAESLIDLNGRQKYYDGTYFLPSSSDLDTPHVFDEYGKQFINLVEAMIVTTSIPRVWIWQTASERVQEYASKAMDNYYKTISRDITESDIHDLIVELKSVGLNLYVGNLNHKNPAMSITKIFSTLDMHTGYIY